MLTSSCRLQASNFQGSTNIIRKQFDQDVRHLVKIKVVHGSWRSDDGNGLNIAEACSRHANVENIKAYMPEAYGTHHSKMIVLFCHNDVAQVAITTGNFIEKDWSMSQAFWCSPELPLSTSTGVDGDMRIGSGERFKIDLLAYFKAYGSKLTSLQNQIRQYDFHAVRAALVASVPSKLRPSSVSYDEPLWGLPALKRVLKHVRTNPTKQAHIVTQMSSVASVGEKWLTDTFFTALSTTSNCLTPSWSTPKYSIIFPTPAEIRNSISGYGSGSSIHMKISAPAQQRQLDFLRPMLCHWGPSKPPSAASSGTARNPVNVEEVEKPSISTDLPTKTGKAARHPAAPHIKTYTRFSDSSMQTIDWAMMTSANLSTQAWGSSIKDAEVRICSYEIGVVVWPALWEEDGRKAIMVPKFGGDMPTEADRPPRVETQDATEGYDNDEHVWAQDEHTTADEAKGKQRTENSRTAEQEKDAGMLVGWRMPYDLPLNPYKSGEDPWCNSIAHHEPDWMGRNWPGR